MKIHRLVTLTISARLNEARAPAFDLHSAARLLLNVLHIGTTLTDDLGSQVKTGDWLEINSNALIGPFALGNISQRFSEVSRGASYTAILIPLDLLLGLPAAEAALVNEVRKLFLHKIINYDNSLLETILIRACNVEVKRRTLKQAD